MKKIHSKLIIFNFLLCLVVSLNAQDLPGFYVKGRYLYDNCSERVMLRGVSYPNIWFQKSGLPHFEEIEKTGANVIRIVWDTQNTASDLDIAITNCRNLDMIPLVELHDATGDLSKLQMCVDYWVSSEVLDVIFEHEEYLLINIANEAGDGSVTKTQFINAYESAVLEMRDAGIQVPLIIDAPDWGKNINVLQSSAPSLIESDPDHNLLFSVHMWWPKMYGFTESSIVNEIKQSVDMGIPLIVGEFSQMHGACEEDVINSENSIAYKTIIRECQLNKVGYIAWSWFGNCNPFWDMSTNGDFDNLYDWGLEVAVTDTNSIFETSVRPYSFLHNACNPDQEEYPDETTGIETLNGRIGFGLEQNSPNPFTEITSINYSIPYTTLVIIKVYNILGDEVATLENSPQTAGEHNLLFDAGDLDAGIYYYSIKAGNFCESKKMVHIVF